MKRSPLERHTPLRRTESRPRRRPVSPASKEQRAKVKGAVCRNCGRDESTPMHVVDRSLGGCDSDLCVIPCCWACHRSYDLHEWDCLPLLSLEEQAHAVGHLGIVGALERLTNENWAPERRAA